MSAPATPPTPEEPAWAPLSRRQASGGQVLVEGVPAHLERPLRRWVKSALDSPQGDVSERVALRLHLVVEELEAVCGTAVAREAVVWGTPRELLLDLVDAVLFLHPARAALRRLPPVPPRSADDSTLDHVNRAAVSLSHSQLWWPWRSTLAGLDQLLEDAASAYRTAPDGDGLRRRVDATATAAAQAAGAVAVTAGATAAARDLAAAWAAVHRLHPDPSEAYRLVIRAVEHVAVPVVLPQNRAATLTQVRNHLRDAPAKWQLANGGEVAALVGMLTVLTSGQTDRHGGQSSSPPTHAAAEMAVHLGAALVQWFAAGHVRRAAPIDTAGAAGVTGAMSGAGQP